MKLKYNLQFFAEDGGEENGGATSGGASDSGDNAGNGDGNEVDVQAFADLISEKDKEIQQLQKDVAELKKTNANLLVRVSAGENKVEFDTEKAILEFCDTRKAD